MSDMYHYVMCFQCGSVSSHWHFHSRLSLWHCSQMHIGVKSCHGVAFLNGNGMCFNVWVLECPTFCVEWWLFTFEIFWWTHRGWKI